MGKWHLAVCDSDEKYIDKFVEFVQETKKSLFDIKSFTSINGVLEYLKENAIDVLLISNKDEMEELNQTNIKNTIFLSDGNQKQLEYPCINKFQSAENVIREVMEYAIGLEKNPTEKQEVFNKCCKLIGIYSPLNRCYKTSFAIILGILYAKLKKVLYINFEEFSGFSKFLSIFENKDISDLMYFYKQNPKNLLTKLYSCTNNLNGLDYINPVIFSNELRNFETFQWVDFIKFISENSNYEIIILDFSNMIKDIFEMLEICDVIYMPVLEDNISVAKINEFESYLELFGKDKILEKINKINLPEIKNGDRGEKHFEILLKGEFGNFVRKILV